MESGKLGKLPRVVAARASKSAGADAWAKGLTRGYQALRTRRQAQKPFARRFLTTRWLVRTENAPRMVASEKLHRRAQDIAANVSSYVRVWHP